jgi:ketosteroid isomerase-like protein
VVNRRRRTLLAAGGVAVLGAAAGTAPVAAGAAAARGADVASLQAAFDRLSQTLNGGDVAGFLGLFHERALVIDEDSPFRNTKAEFIDHLGFHGPGNWQGFAWVPRETRLYVRGDTGYTAGTVTFRGKPVDSGFRLRHMMHTIGWNRPSAAGEWKIVLFHQAPLYGHLHGTSPGTGN